MSKTIDSRAEEEILVSITLTESAEKILHIRPHQSDTDFVTETFFCRYGSWDGELNENQSESVLKEVTVKVAPIEFIENKNPENEASTSDAVKDGSDNVDSALYQMCRICHAGISMGELLAPCKCRGSIANAHMYCLQRWLKESGNSNCELCQHHFQIIRKPKYSIPMSVLVFLRHPGAHLREILLDLFAFSIYTPSAVISTYILTLICDKCNAMRQKTALSANIVACSAILGMAAIDFTYSSWLTLCFQRHQAAWHEWYRNSCELQIILPPPSDDKQSNGEDSNED